MYLLFSASALTAAILGLSVVAHVPQPFFAPFAVGVFGNFAFAIGTYCHARVLKGQQYGVDLPTFRRVATHGMGFAVVAMIASVLAFRWVA